MRNITALQMRKKLGYYLDAVGKRKQRILVTRANRPLVVMVPAADYQAGEQSAARRVRLEKVAAQMDAARKKRSSRLQKVDVLASLKRARKQR